MTKTTDEAENMNPVFHVRGMYFSGTGTTETTVRTIAQRLAGALQENAGATSGMEPTLLSFDKYEDINFTPPAMREEVYQFGKSDILVFGVPVIAGRVPNVLLPFLNTLEGGGAMAVPVVLYGNRNFDDALIELRNILEERGFHTVAAAAFIGEHSFSRILAAGRPDQKDLKIAEEFAEKTCARIRDLIARAAGKEADSVCRAAGMPHAGDGTDLPLEEALQRVLEEAGPIPVDGEDPIRPYYKPRDRKGNHINILKVKPKLDESKCTRCGICVEVCPMGSIRAEEPGVVSGICIKCCGCEKKCPEGALYFDDEGYLYHKTELELGYPDRKEPKLFL